MKRCPACGSTFTDDSLRFCLQDGATLLPSSEPTQDFNLAQTLRDDEPLHRSEPPPTEKFNLNAAPTVLTNRAAPTVPVRSDPSTRETDDDRTPAGRSNPVVVAGITAVVVLLLVLGGFGIVYLLRDKSSGSANTTPTGNNTQSANAANTSASRNRTNATNGNIFTSTSNTQPRTDSPVKITATASSTRAPEKGFTYVPSNVLDDSLLTAWVEGANGPGLGEWIRCDFDREVKLHRILIAPGYFKTTDLWLQNNRLAAATFSFSDGTSRRFTFPNLNQEQRLDVGNVKTRWVRLTIQDIYPGSVDSEDTPISQLTFEFDE